MTKKSSFYYEQPSQSSTSTLTNINNLSDVERQNSRDSQTIKKSNNEFTKPSSPLKVNENYSYGNGLNMNKVLDYKSYNSVLIHPNIRLENASDKSSDKQMDMNNVIDSLKQNNNVRIKGKKELQL